MTATAIDPGRIEAFAGRLFGAATASLELATVYLGDRLGLYRVLAEHGPQTAAELAQATATHERYVREWARAQAVCGILEAGGRAVDMGCGAGLAAVELAKRYPRACIEGVDVDEASIDLARANARAAGVDVRFHVRDASDPGLDEGYDLIALFDSLHHLARPLDALQRMRALLAPGGTVLVADGRAEGDFERFTHLVSVIHCLPTAIAEQPSAAMGAVVEPEAILALAADAGFAHAEVTPIDHETLRFFALR